MLNTNITQIVICIITSFPLIEVLFELYERKCSSQKSPVHEYDEVTIATLKYNQTLENQKSKESQIDYMESNVAYYSHHSGKVIMSDCEAYGMNPTPHN